MSRTDVLDLIAIILVTAFALLIWPPAALLVLAAACLLVSWRASR